MTFSIKVTLFSAPSAQKSTIEINIKDDLKPKVNQILEAGFHFEAEENSQMISTTISKNADLAFAVSPKPTTMKDQIVEIEKMIEGFDIKNGLATLKELEDYE